MLDEQADSQPLSPSRGPFPKPTEQDEQQALSILRQVISEALSPLAQKVNSLAETLDKTASELREEIQQIQQHSFADGVPDQFRTNDPAIKGRMSAARSVTLATRPVRDNPEQYANPVAPDTIVRNSKSNPVREEE